MTASTRLSIASVSLALLTYAFATWATLRFIARLLCPVAMTRFAHWTIPSSSTR